MNHLILFFILVVSIHTQSYENQKQKLSQKLSDLIIFKGSEYVDNQNQGHIYGGNNSKDFHYKYTFDYMKVDKINEIKNRYGFSELISNEIQSTIDNRITGVVDDNEMNDFSKVTENKYVIFKLSFGAALKEKDIIYFMVLEILFHTDLSYNCLTKEGESCYTSWEGIKRCETKKIITPLNFFENQIKIIKDEAYYKIFNSLKYNAQFLGDLTIQLFITNGNAIYSEDGENAAYVGEFGDIAIGPTKYLNSIQPLKHYNVYCDGNYAYQENDGEFSCFKGDDCSGTSYVYPGQMVHKFTMVLDNINPTSTVYTHRTQMKERQNSNYYYCLILYTNGELTLVKKYNYSMKRQGTNKVDEIIWTSNTKGKGVPPYKLQLSKNYRLQLLDSNNEIIYQSKEYINIPTIRYKVVPYTDCCTYHDSYNGYEINHSYYNTDNAFFYFIMGVDDQNYPNLQIDYYYLDNEFRWIKNKKQFSVVRGAAGLNYFARALKMMLSGPGSENFKICYYIRYRNKYYKGIFKSPIVCDGESTKVTDRDNQEYFTSFIAFITLKSDTNPQ